MIVQSHNVMLNNRLEQARLATALVDSLGLEGAIFACRANGWDGVLEFLLGPEARELAFTAPQPYHV
jgi:hypothetical protein